MFEWPCHKPFEPCIYIPESGLPSLQAQVFRYYRAVYLTAYAPYHPILYLFGMHGENVAGGCADCFYEDVGCDLRPYRADMAVDGAQPEPCRLAESQPSSPREPVCRTSIVGVGFGIEVFTESVQQRIEGCQEVL